jgi:hypothetical protein
MPIHIREGKTSHNMHYLLQEQTGVATHKKLKETCLQSTLVRETS